jgi:hypothetical protein
VLIVSLYAFLFFPVDFDAGHHLAIRSLPAVDASKQSSQSLIRVSTFIRLHP